MDSLRACLPGLTLLVCAAPLPAEEPAPAIQGKLAAAQQLVDKKPSADRWLGLAEMRFAAGQAQAGLDALRRAKADGDLLCWRALTLYPGQPRALREGLTPAREAGGWQGVALLY